MIVNKPKFDYLIASFMAFLERLRVLNVENAYDVQRLVPVYPFWLTDVREMSSLSFSVGYNRA
jgi:hypothetical protein